MRKKPSSPYTELMEANKKIATEDGKHLDCTNSPAPYSQSFQQLTQFRIPQHFELLHKRNQKKTEINQEYNQPQQNQINLVQIHKNRQNKDFLRRKPFSMSRFQTAQLESDSITSGTFNRTNYTLNKILSSLPITQLQMIHEAKQENIQGLIQKKTRISNRKLQPKFNLKSDSYMAQFFGASNIFPTLSTIRMKTQQ